MSSVENMDFRYLMQNQKRIGKSFSEKKEKQIIEYDFKIVSFKIGNEYYGIDIMSVKEILKEKKFTRIPNALDFVKGVLNLRGDIMPVIDLAKMFHLKTTEKNKNELDSIVIIKVENLLIGIIVEQIQHVIPLRRDDIQPPSPLLGSINERYISGVVDLNDKLFVILDTEAIFSDKEKAKKETIPQESDLSEEFFAFFVNQVEEFCGIHIQQVNKAKFRTFYNDYVKENNIVDMPKISKETADKCLYQFMSIHTDEFWESLFAERFSSAVLPHLSKICSDEVNVLDVGCGSGHETFSLYITLKNMLHDSDVKIVAVDVNLGAVSSASGMEVSGEEIPLWMDKNNNFINSNGNSYKIKKEINDKIYFEFHDAKNLASNNKKFDIVVARDMSLFLKEAEYNQFIEDVTEKMVRGGVLVIGDNEVVNNPKLVKHADESISVYIKN